MNLFLYIFLGIIQGITEPIPVSSSGHLIILNELFNLEGFNDLNFEIFANFGSFIAVCVYYRKEIINIISDFFSYIKTKNKKYQTNFNYSWMIVIGVIPVGFTGLFFKSAIEKYTSCKLVGISLLITALILYLTKDINGKKKKEDITFKDALFVGITSVIALIPGISRSGATLAPSLYRKLDKETAFNYSFMLYIPVSIGTIILGIRDLISSNNLSELIIPYIIGMIVSFIFTYITIKWFKKIVENKQTNIFVYYCIIVGLLTIIFL